MLANVAHSPAWRSQGYVCLACRRQRVQAHRHRQQYRRNSELSQSQTPTPSAGDFWADGLNDINDSYGTPTKPSPPEKKPADEKKASPSKLAPKWKQHRVADGPKTLPHLTSDLANHIKKPAASGQEQIEHKSRIRKQQHSSYSSQDDLPTKKPKPTPSGDSPSVVDLRNMIVGELREDAQTRAAKQDAELEKRRRVPGTGDGAQEKPVSLSLPAFGDSVSRRIFSKQKAPAVDNIQVPRGKTVKGPRVEDLDQDTIDEIEKVVGSAPIKIGSNIVDKPMRLVDRHRSNLKSTIGFGVQPNQAPATPNGVSFNSLRDADKITPEETIATAVNNTPFGLASSEGNTSGGETVNGLLSQLYLKSDGSAEVVKRILQDDDHTGPASGEDTKLPSPQATDPPYSPLQQRLTEALRAKKAAEERNDSSPSTEALSKPSVKHVEADAAADQLTGVSQSSVEGLMQAYERLGDLYKQRNQSPTTSEPPKSKEGEKQQMAPGESASDTKEPTPAKPGQPSETGGKGKPSPRRRHSLRKTRAMALALERAESGRLIRFKTKNGHSHTRPSGAPPDSTNSNDDTATNDPLSELAGQSIADAMAAKKPRAKKASEPTPDPPAPSAPAAVEEEQAATEAVESISPSSLEIAPLDIPQPPVPYLEYGLDRVLFNPGVYQLQDPASRVYNFDPYLQQIMPVNQFDFNALKEYKTSSQDKALSELAREQNKKYIGSTSSMTSSLAHFHYLLSNWRPLNLNMMSSGFISRSAKAEFTQINRAPSAIFLRYKNGSYAIDADKEYDSGNVLMLLGKSLELLLTLPTSEYERYRKSDPREVSEEQKTSPESYQYTTMRDFLMRSQLDAYDPRLPGTGTFDLKTRAVVSIRMSAKDYEPMTGYELYSLHGKWGSYEREYYDMMRSTMLKYMLQARMGRMNGIFVAYHNVKRIFGFQYIPIHELDRALHGQTDSSLGDQEFKASLDIMNEVLNKATAKFPEKSLRFHFETRPEQSGGMPTALHVFAEPMEEEEIDRIQNSGKAKIEAFERDIMGKTSESAEESSSNDDASAPATDDPVNVAEEVASGTQEVESAIETSTAEEIADTSEMPNLQTSDSHADKPFLASIDSSGKGPTKALFYATVIVQSKVNGEIPENDRPKDLKKTDKWEIDYILKEYETTSYQWSLYEDCKARRKHALNQGQEDEDAGDAESEGKSRRDDYYIRFLRDMAERGREMRGRIDDMEKGNEVVRVDEGLPREREEIGSLEDYMGWMYRKKDA